MTMHQLDHVIHSHSKQVHLHNRLTLYQIETKQIIHIYLRAMAYEKVLAVITL